MARHVTEELTVLWSPKGGVGTTVTAAGLALQRVHAGSRVLLIDLCGDLPAALGTASASGPGVTDWLCSEDAPDEVLERLAVDVCEGLSLLPTGESTAQEWATDRAMALQRALLRMVESGRQTVVVDAGRCGGALDSAWRTDLVSLLGELGRSLMVTRACYLAVRAALASSVHSDGLVVIAEPGRSLDDRDVADVLSLPVLARIDLDPAVARCVDAGLLGRRVPRSVQVGLAGLG